MFITLVSLIVAAAPVKIAVPEWTVVNMKPELAGFYAEESARALRSHGLEVITSRDIATILGIERQRQLLECSEGNSCMAELGAAMGSEAVLLANIARLDQGYRGSLRVISSNSGKTLVEHRIDANGERALVDSIDEAAAEIARVLLPATPVPSTSLRSRAWIPLVGAALFAGGGAACLIVGKQNLDAIARSDQQTAQALARDGRVLEPVGWALVGVGAAAAATGVLFIALGGPPEVTPSVGVTSSGASVGLSGVFP